MANWQSNTIRAESINKNSSKTIIVMICMLFCLVKKKGVGANNKIAMPINTYHDI